MEVRRTGTAFVRTDRSGYACSPKILANLLDRLPCPLVPMEATIDSSRKPTMTALRKMIALHPDRPGGSRVTQPRSQRRFRPDKPVGEPERINKQECCDCTWQPIAASIGTSPEWKESTASELGHKQFCTPASHCGVKTIARPFGALSLTTCRCWPASGRMLPCTKPAASPTWIVRVGSTCGHQFPRAFSDAASLLSEVDVLAHDEADSPTAQGPLYSGGASCGTGMRNWSRSPRTVKESRWMR